MSKPSVSKYRPPARSNNILTDIYQFLIKKPKAVTHIKFSTAQERTNYNNRIMQRIGIDPNHYSILNLHGIGVDAPVRFLFDELKQWNGDSTCWPNHLAKVERIEDDLKRIRILPFGWKKYPLPLMKSFFGFNLIPLFLLDAIRIKDTPDSFDFDNARYILYNCSGGYPIGIFLLYVRSSIPAMGEVGISQLFLAVCFNFYGKEGWQEKRKWVNVLWEFIHNRVTSHVLSRLKELGEWRIATIQNK